MLSMLSMGLAQNDGKEPGDGQDDAAGGGDLLSRDRGKEAWVDHQVLSPP
jgi:hypothetical protein